MPSIIAPKFAKAVTIASTGIITVDSTASIYVGQVGQLYKSGNPGVRVEVTEVRSSTTFLAKLAPEKYDPTGLSGYKFNSAPSDLSAYTLGTIFFEEQSVRTNQNVG